MNINEAVRPIGKNVGYARGNCFIDSKGFIHTTAHLLEKPRNDYKSESFKEGLVYLRSYDMQPVQFQFRLWSDRDYAGSVERINQNPSKLKFATQIPNEEFEIYIVSAIPTKRIEKFKALIVNTPLKEYSFRDRIVFHMLSGQFSDGDSGSMVVWDEPGVFGRFFRIKSDLRILGIYSAERGGHQINHQGIAEICPQVYGEK